MSSFIEVQERRHKQELVERLLVEKPFQLNLEDWDTVYAALGFITTGGYKYKSCQLFSCGLFSSGLISPGPHLYARRRAPLSICAEIAVILLAHFYQRVNVDNALVTLATFHGAHNFNGEKHGQPYLLTPCDGCVRLLEQVAPQAMIVACIDKEGNLADLDKGRIIKLPQDAIKYFPHPRKHNGE